MTAAALPRHLSRRLARPAAVAATALLLALVAQAQVVRCTDARTGKVSYTDGRCERGTAAHEVLPRQSPAEIERERAQAAQALVQQQQRQQADAAARREAERDAEHQRVQAARAAAEAARTAPQDQARSPECARARRNLDMAAKAAASSLAGQDAPWQVAQRQMELDCLGPQGYVEVEKNRQLTPPMQVVPAHRPAWQRPPAPPPPFTQCNVFRCYDREGRSYARP